MLAGANRGPKLSFTSGQTVTKPFWDDHPPFYYTKTNPGFNLHPGTPGGKYSVHSTSWNPPTSSHHPRPRRDSAGGGGQTISSPYSIGTRKTLAEMLPIPLGLRDEFFYSRGLPPTSSLQTRPGWNLYFMAPQGSLTGPTSVWWQQVAGSCYRGDLSRDRNGDQRCPAYR